MRVDCHVHFWQLGSAYPNEAQRFEALKHDFMPPDLIPQMQAAGVDRVVLVQAARMLEETRYYLDLAAELEIVGAVVGWVDLEAADLPETLQTLRARGPWLQGIREVCQSLPDKRWFLRPQVIEGLKALRDADLVWDFLVLSSQLRDSLTALEQVPDLRCVYNHSLKPEITQGEWDGWTDVVRDIAANTAACVKLSGLCEMTDAQPRSTADWVALFKPYVGHLLECFGPQRVLFATNWPVVQRGGSTYAQWFETVTTLLDGFGISGADRDAILGGNSVRMYRVR